MADEPFYAPSRTPPPARVVRPGEPRWTLARNGRTVTCELRDDGDAGCEAQLWRDGVFYAGRRFGNRGQAQAHGDDVRAQLERDGWWTVADEAGAATRTPEAPASMT